LETSLELLRQHSEAGDDTTYVYCERGPAYCDMNIGAGPLVCLSCRTKNRIGRSRLGLHGAAKILQVDDLSKPFAPDQVPEFKTIGDLKSFTWNGFDVGMGVASTLIWVRRDPRVDVIRERKTIVNLAARSISLFAGFQDYLDEEKPDVVYVFNGRFSLCRAVVCACKMKNVTFKVHERGSSIDKYELTTNALPHNIEPFQRKMLLAWQEADPVKRKAIAEDFYLARQRGVIQSWYPYTDKQDKKRLPVSWNSECKNIVIFNTSEDEVAAIGKEWENDIYANQTEGIVEIVNSLADVPDTVLYLRLHPNLKGVDNQDIRRLNSLESAIFHVIPADSPVSSYELMSKADLVITFGSTAGIEAAFMGKPSMLLGKCCYMGFDCVYSPKNHGEAIALCKRNLPPLDSESALIYGYYMNTYGIPYKWFQPTDVHKGSFMGSQIRVPGWLGLLERLRWPGFGMLARLLLFVGMRKRNP
jgi:hypothetical protein